MHKAFKFRLYPNSSQINLINRTIGCSRFVFNHFLEKNMRIFKDADKSLSYATSCKDLTLLKKDIAWLKEVDSMALQQSLKDLDKAFKNFFRDKEVGYPNFKSKRSPKQSYRTNANNNIQIENNKIKLPKLGWVKFAKSREVEGKILSATIRRTPTGKYFISILCDTEILPLPKNSNQVGIDLGIKEFAITSDGKTHYNPKYYRKHEKRLQKLQRQLSRKQKGSKNRNKARIKVAKQHEKIRNCRLDFLHKLSTKLISENQTICLEDLKVGNMVKKTANYLNQYQMQDGQSFVLF